jgi:pectinesterase
MITGENDYASTRGDELRSKMNDLGIPNGLTIIKDAPHSFNVKQVWFDEAMQKAGEFFIKRLMSGG